MKDKKTTPRKGESYIAPERMYRFTTTKDDGIIFWTPSENRARKKKAKEALDHERNLEVRQRRKDKRMGK